MTTNDTAVASDPYYDPFSREINASPHAAFKRLRDEAPLYYNERFDFYALSRFDDVQAVRVDPATYTNTEGAFFERMLDRDQPRMMLSEMDPPEQTAFRRVTTRRFSPKAMGDLAESVRSHCRTLIEATAGRTEFDLVEVFAKPLPMMVTSSLLGVDPAAWDELRAVFARREEAIARPDCDMEAVVAAEDGIRSRLLDLAVRRRAEPREDLVSVLVAAELDDPGTGPRPMTDEEVASYCLALYAGGNTTTTLMLSWAAILLAAHPGQRRLLADRPELIPGAVEEILRFEPVSHAQGRTTTTEVEWHGTTVPAGSKVLMLTGAALRDERHYDRPDEFDVTRQVESNTAFGFGAHFCIGAHLARLEGRIALEELLAHFPAWEVEPTADDMRISTSLRGYYSLPMSVSSR